MQVFSKDIFTLKHLDGIAQVLACAGCGWQKEIREEKAEGSEVCKQDIWEQAQVLHF